MDIVVIYSDKRIISSKFSFLISFYDLFFMNLDTITPDDQMIHEVRPAPNRGPHDRRFCGLRPRTQADMYMSAWRSDAHHQNHQFSIFNFFQFLKHRSTLLIVLFHLMSKAGSLD